MRVLVTGGRTYGHNDSDQVQAAFAALDALIPEEGPSKLVLIHGGCTGADTVAQCWAEARGVHQNIHEADWQRHGRAAGPIRNQAMVDSKPDLVLAFPGRRGTADMVRRAKLAGVPVRFA